MISVMQRRAVAAAIVSIFAFYQARPGSQPLPTVTSPRQQFGASIGDDYFLATYRQFEEYSKKLDDESDRLTMVPIGRTEEQRTQWMAIISAPENIASLDRYRDISRRLALAENISDDEARQLAEQGKTIVFIAGGLHADEVLGVQQLIETMYQLASASDAETLRFLRDVVVLAVHANPDGHALVADWYMREPTPERRSLAGLPRAYQKYIGHDNNRDFYLASQAETININRVLYKEWFPQIVYDHHQPGPAGTVMFAPPFRGPFNNVFDPLILPGIDLMGAAMHARFAAEGKAGVTMRGGSTYSTWWNGGLRTTAYFHNQIGLLTETIGNPTPIEIPSVAARQLPSVDLPQPIAPQRWQFRRSIEYSLTANRAVLDAASRYRETLLFNAYRMGRNAIARGSEDSWVPSPRRTATRDPARRTPRAYVLPADQPDFLTATKLVDALLKAGITVHQATSAFEVNGTTYAAGSYVVKAAQAFRPHLLDMFEPQEHPDDIPSPGAAPIAPYDIAGWTLAFQMGVRFDRILDALDGPFETVATAAPPRGSLTGASAPAGYLLSHHQNDAFIAVNRLLGAGEQIFWLDDRTLGAAGGTGSIYITAGASTRATLERAAADLGLSAVGTGTPPRGTALKLRPVRVGLWDRYGGSTTSGWVRWILERYEFPFERVYAQALDSADLVNLYDVLILPDDAVPGGRRSDPVDVPAEYRSTTGAISWERTVPKLKDFVERGGTLILIGNATAIAASLGAPVSDALVSTGRGGPQPLTRESFYIPGSVLRVTVDSTTPLAYGFETQVDVMFENSQVFAITSEGRARRVAWFATDAPLRSGWAWGQHHLRNGVAVVDAPIGRGRVVVLGPEITFRGQSHGTFKFLFNAIHLARTEPAVLR